LAEQAKVLVAEAEEKNLRGDAFNERLDRWHMCSLCEQTYHGVVRCALGWACWKTYLGRPEANWARRVAMTDLGIGLKDAGHFEDALSVQEAELSTERRPGASELDLLIVQGNLATSYQLLGRLEEAMSLRRDVYSATLRLHGEEHAETIREASNYAVTLGELQRFEEAKALLRKMIPVARRVLGASHDSTIRTQWIYARSLWGDRGAKYDDVRAAMKMLEETERTACHVLGPSHPTSIEIGQDLKMMRARLYHSNTLVFAVAIAIIAWLWRYLTNE
jgi:tetratricopeptide (TPR) repeat protein